jgi:hypothetical protein
MASLVHSDWESAPIARREAALNREILLLFIMPVLAMTPPSLAAEELSLFDWAEIAPVVVAGVAQEQDGRHTVFRIDRVLRGEVAAGESLLIDLRYANRRRDYDVDPRPLRLRPGTNYVVLLQKASPGKKKDKVAYRIIRGPRGARELPAEGAQALLDALERFILIQQMGDDRATWRLMGAMLEETNPVLLETALGQFLKFRRGDAELLPAIVPLLDHPSAEIRMSGCRLIGQIVSRYAAAGIEHEEELRSAVAARARSDEVVAVRVAATESLGAFEGREATEILQEIAAEDPDQSVRYAAERILFNRRGAIDFPKSAAYDRRASLI